jgi:hypothetical protein
MRRVWHRFSKWRESGLFACATRVAAFRHVWKWVAAGQVVLGERRGDDEDRHSGRPSQLSQRIIFSAKNIDLTINYQAFSMTQTNRTCPSWFRE